MQHAHMSIRCMQYAHMSIRCMQHAHMYANRENRCSVCTYLCRPQAENYSMRVCEKNIPLTHIYIYNSPTATALCASACGLWTRKWDGRASRTLPTYSSLPRGVYPYEWTCIHTNEHTHIHGLRHDISRTLFTVHVLLFPAMVCVCVCACANSYTECSNFEMKQLIYQRRGAHILNHSHMRLIVYTHTYFHAFVHLHACTHEEAVSMHIRIKTWCTYVRTRMMIHDKVCMVHSQKVDLPLLFIYSRTR